MTSAAQRIQVGAELRAARERLGLSGVRVAADLGWSQSKVSRIEAGLLKVSLSDLSALLDCYGLPDDVRAELLNVAVVSDGLPGAWVVRAGGPPRRQGEVASMESRVRVIRQYAPLTVPGLLQVPSYTRALARALGVSDVEGVVVARLARQERFVTGALPTYRLVLDERALFRTPGDRQVLIDQVRRLADDASGSRIELRLLGAGVGAQHLGLAPFILYDFVESGSPSVVQLESATADTYLSAPDDVMAYERLFDDLAGEALSPSHSRERLRSMLSEHGPEMRRKA